MFVLKGYSVMRYKLFSLVLFCFALFLSCAKEPRTGEYKGLFSGKYIAEDSVVVLYQTDYYFTVPRSTRKELRLMEKQSQVTSILTKHASDSVSGMIGFGSVFLPNTPGLSGFNTISVRGKYNKSSIRGKFSATFFDENKEYRSEGEFILEAY
jgi:hypothetical protein